MLEQAWDDLVARHPRGHLLQTRNWGALKARFGWEAERVLLQEDGRLVAGAQVLYRPFPSQRLPLARVAYLPKGPLVDWDDGNQVREVLRRVTAAARRRRALFVRIEPHLEQDEAAGVKGLLQAAGFVVRGRPVQPRRTLLLDIRPDEEAILGQMKPKTRYNIRLAGRKGVTVREGGRDDLPAFDRLMATTGERNEFGVHSSAYYQAVYDLFAPRGELGLLLAEYEGRPLAGLMLFCLAQTAWYFYGASSDDERQRMPAYLLQWEAIRWARSRGCALYDLWGVPDEDEETLEANFTERSEGLWGVYRFKRGFGGRLVRWAGAHDRPLIRPLYQLYRVLGRDDG